MLALIYNAIEVWSNLAISKTFYFEKKENNTYWIAYVRRTLRGLPSSGMRIAEDLTLMDVWEQKQNEDPCDHKQFWSVSKLSSAFYVSLCVFKPFWMFHMIKKFPQGY